MYVCKPESQRIHGVPKEASQRRHRAARPAPPPASTVPFAAAGSSSALFSLFSSWQRRSRRCLTPRRRAGTPTRCSSGSRTPLRM